MTLLQQVHAERAPKRLCTGEKWADTKGNIWFVDQVDEGRALVRNPLMEGKRVNAEPPPRGWHFVDANFAYPRLKKEVCSLLQDFEDLDHCIEGFSADDALAAIRERLQKAIGGQI